MSENVKNNNERLSSPEINPYLESGIFKREVAAVLLALRNLLINNKKLTIDILSGYATGCFILSKIISKRWGGGGEVVEEVTKYVPSWLGNVSIDKDTAPHSLDLNFERAVLFLLNIIEESLPPRLFKLDDDLLPVFDNVDEVDEFGLRDNKQTLVVAFRKRFAYKVFKVVAIFKVIDEVIETISR